jgi:hypothetical protein
MFSQCSVVDFTQRWAMAVAACLVGEMELRVQAVFKVVQTGRLEKFTRGLSATP